MESNVLDKEISSCWSNALVKAGIGASVGVAISLVMYKRRPVWPITGCAGFGLGMAYSECNLNLNKSLKSHLEK